MNIVVVATGQATRTDWLTGLVELDHKGRVLVDEQQRTSHLGIWAGGDCVTGGQEVVNAVAEGVAAARSIHETLETR